MINVLLVGIGLGISLLLFQGMTSSGTVSRLFNDLGPYLMNNCVVADAVAPEPYFQTFLIDNVLKIHFSSLDDSLGPEAYSYSYQVGEYLSARRYPQFCRVSLKYSSILGSFSMSKQFRIVEGNHA